MEEPSSDEPRVVLDAPEGFDGHSDGALSEFAGEAAATEAARPWRVAQSLLMSREAVNAAFPRRGKAGDGTIGDAAHASRSNAVSKQCGAAATLKALQTSGAATVPA